MSEDSRPDPTFNSADSPGATLRQAREKYGLSIDDVADELNLSTSQIRALEDNRFEDLPGKTYVQGYLRSYARLLNSDDNDILLNLDQQEDATISGIRPVMRETRSTDRHMKLLSLGVALVLGGLTFMWWQNRDQSTFVPLEVTEEMTPLGAAGDDPESTQFEGDTDMEVAHIGQLEELESTDDLRVNGQETNASGGEDLDSTSTATTMETEAAPPQGEAEAEIDAVSDVDTTQSEIGIDQIRIAQQAENSVGLVQTNPPETVAVESQTEAVAETAPATAQASLQEREDDQSTEPSPPHIELGHEVKLKFSATSWVDLRDANGQRLLYENVNKGREIAVQGKPPFSIFLGNADGVEIDYGGEPFDFSAFTNGIYARFELGVEHINQP